MSSEPRIGGREPVPVELVARRTYWWRRCGRSQSQTLCDGSHEGTGIEPPEWRSTATAGLYNAVHLRSSILLRTRKLKPRKGA